jgi:hypothetical protein
VADAAAVDAVWRQTVAEFDRGLTIARALLKRGQFTNAMAVIEQCQALLGVMDGIQQTARVVPVEELERAEARERVSEPTANFESRGGAQ